MHSQLYAPIFSEPFIASIFSDEIFVGQMLHIEAMLAKVQAELGVIPQEAANKIIKSCEALQLEEIDFVKLAAGVEKSSIPTIEFLKQVRQKIGGEAASYLHWGATTQDIMDTALVLQMREALAHLDRQMMLVIENLATMAEQHRHTIMAGRSHSQQALPISFGLKVANWLSPLLQQKQRLEELKARLLVVQFGGAVGTLASLGDDGLKVQEALAHELNLGVPLSTWHTQRDNLVEVANWLSLMSGSLAKMAQDIILMAQSEIAEVLESDDVSRGGSSTMPQKRNPIVSEMIISAARSNAALLSAMHNAMIQEHERATHGWQMEWFSLPQMFSLTGVALSKALFLSENLVVNVEQMRRNVIASNGLMLAEALNLALAPVLGRAESKQVIKEACAIVLAENRHLVDVMREQVAADVDWDSLREEANYLGTANVMIDKVLEKAHSVLD